VPTLPPGSDRDRANAEHARWNGLTAWERALKYGHPTCAQLIPGAERQAKERAAKRQAELEEARKKREEMEKALMGGGPKSKSAKKASRRGGSKKRA
jgi:hypothetical protein